MNVKFVRLRPQLAALFAGLVGHASWAAQSTMPASPTALAALQTLLTSQVGRADPNTKDMMVAGAATTASPVASGLAVSAGAVIPAAGRTLVNIERGQGLDAVLRQHMAASPLRIEIQRELVRQLNPQAFAPGNAYRLLAGARLQLPTLQDQAQHAFGSAMAAAGAQVDRQADDRGGATSAARKGWVRYP